MYDHSKAVDLSNLVQNARGRATSRELCLASAVINMAGELEAVKGALASMRDSYCLATGIDSPLGATAICVVSGFFVGAIGRVNAALALCGQEQT